jgi:hypothetical protein
MTLKSSWLWVTPKPGKGTLGTRWFRASHVQPGSELEDCRGLSKRGYWQTVQLWGVCEPALKPRFVQEGLYPENVVKSRDQNRTREIRLSGIAGRLTETWATVKAKRARKVETLKQPSLCLRLRAPYFYPDIFTSGSERGVKLFYKAEYCGTPQSKERRNREYKVCLNDRALHLLDHDVTVK